MERFTQVTRSLLHNTTDDQKADFQVKCLRMHPVEQKTDFPEEEWFRIPLLDNMVDFPMEDCLKNASNEGGG